MSENKLFIKNGNKEYQDEIVALYRDFRPNWKPNPKLGVILDSLPSVVTINDQELIGFAYSIEFAPDILEIANIFVSEKYRCLNLGTSILSSIETQAVDLRYSGLILCNSDSYKSSKEKRPATNFYLNNNYKITAETSNTRVFFKCLA